MKALIVLSSFVLLFASQAVAEVFTDDFEISHDYLTAGVTGTSWDGFIGLGAGETVDELNASIDRAGQLYIESIKLYLGGPLEPARAVFVQGD